MARTFGCVTWTLTPWLMTSTLTISMKTSLASFDISGYSPVCPLPMRVSKKVTGLMKDKLGRRIMTKFVALRLKLYTYNVLDGSGDKKYKGVKKCIVKKMLDFEDYKQYLTVGQNAFWKQLLFQNKLHEVHNFCKI